MTSSVKRLNNEMFELETKSDKHIDPTNYYILSISYSENTDINIREKAEEFLKFKLNQPLCIYYFNKTLLLIFSCKEEYESHYLNGSYTLIISYYSTTLSLDVGDNVICRIIEFDTRNKLLSYICWKVKWNYTLLLESMSNYEVTQKDIYNYTLKEICNSLKDVGFDIDKYNEEEKYGVLIKLDYDDKGEIIVNSISEDIDFLKFKKYYNFIFK